jgi:hypothetical protein
VARPGETIQGAEIGNHLRPEGVEVEVADEFQEIRLLFRHDGLVPVLEEGADAFVAPVEGPPARRGEQRAHIPREGPSPRADQEVGVVREERPGIDPPGARFCERREPREKVVPVGVIFEDNPALQPPHHHVVKGLRSIQARLAGHGTPHLREIIQIELRPALVPHYAGWLAKVRVIALWYAVAHNLMRAIALGAGTGWLARG